MSICLCFTYTQKNTTKLRNQENTGPDPKIALQKRGFCESGKGAGFYTDGETALFAYVLPIHRKN